MVADAVASPYEPVVLDLADPDDYGVLTEALTDYAGRLEHEADEEDKTDVYNGREPGGPQATRFRQDAQRARAIIERIHEQLDANTEARRPRT